MHDYLAEVNQLPLAHFVGWMVCGFGNTFSLYDGYLWINHPHASTYLVVTKCLTYLPTYVVAT
jgi:hypothetical protein